MMEISQNVDLKELPTDEEIMLSLAEELDKDVDKFSSPDIKSSVDLELQNGLELGDLDDSIGATKVIDSITKDLEDQNIEADIAQEHDEDRDLVALLDTINSIDTVNEDIDNIDSQDANNAALDDTVAEIIGAVNEEAEVQEEAENDKNVLEAQDPEEDQEKSEIDLQDKQIETEEVENGKVSEEDYLTKENMVHLKKNDNTVKTAKSRDDPSKDKTKDSEGEKKEKSQNLPEDEIFMDALENISSSDEFDAIDEENVKKTDKSKLEKSQQGSREDITSEDSFDKDEEQTADKSKIEEPIIDLDSTDEGAEDEKTKEQSVEAAETSEMGNPDKPKPVQVVGTSEITEQESEKVEEEKETPIDTEEVVLTATQKLKDDIILEAEDKKAEDKKADVKKAEERKADEKKAEEKIADEKSTKGESSIPTEVADVSKPKEAESEKAKPESKDAESEKAKRELKDAESEKAKPESKDAESDDDEVIFFEPIEKSAKERESKSVKKVDEVVLLSEDEDEVPPVPVKQPQEEQTKSNDKEDLPEEKLTTDAAAANESKEDGDLLVESSDNACDQFEKLKTLDKSKDTPSEDGDSDSSNLLQPSRKSREEVATEADIEVEAETEADAEPEAETEAEVDAEMETDAEVEAVAKPAEHEEDDEQDSPVLPAVKRIRLSMDAEHESSSSTSAKAVTTTSTSSTTTSTSTSTVATSTNCDEPIAAPVATLAKRRNTLLSLEKDITPSKKPRTEDTDSNCSSDGNLQIDLDAHDQEQESDKSRVAAEAAVLKPKDPPIDLKPAQELKTDVKPLRMEFVKSFRKSFDKMSRQDLEELVLQKVVESMLVKSEFAEIRRLVDNHESTLAAYRRKIAEVSKQFLDLETVHKRVLNDLKARNSQFTAPVRITRAVGLQVGMTLMKKPNDDARSSQAGPHAAGSMSAPTQNAPAASNHLQKPTTSPLRSAIRSQPQRMPSALQHVQEQQQRQQQLLYQQQQQQLLSQQQQQQQQQQQPPQRVFFPSATGTPNVRRGCVQKVTPQRPVNHNNSNGNVSPVQTSPHAGMQRMQTSPGSNARVYATKHTSPSARGRPPSTYTQAQRQQQLQQQKLQQQQLQQQQLQQQQLQQQQLQQQQQPLPVRIGRSPGKPAPNATNNAKQRPLPTVSVPLSDASSAVAAAGFGLQPNLAPARPKEKAVIDLTDEDDAAAAAAAAAAAGVDVGARLRQSPGGAVKRNMSSTPSAAARPVAGSVVRVSPMNMPRANAISRQIVSNNTAGQRNSLANVTMQIRSENTPPGGSRQRQQHPAPLPLAPPQKFHPEWKLPPSRPVIRINLHDSGIVISWTLEDTGSRFADCVTYQIYAYQETINEPTTDSWRHVGDVKAMLLPMAVTLNQFQENQRYFFAVRGVDAHDRYGVFSLPKTW